MRQTGQSRRPAAENGSSDAPRPARSNLITPEGFARLRAELNDLWRVQRPKITEEVSAAAAQGDRSENAEYIYGKKKLREIDRRIRFLSKRVESLTVVDPKDQHQTDRIFFGAWFTAEDENGRALTYRIVGSDEFDASAGKISIDSPLARAVLGKRVGDETTVKRPAGDLEIEIIKIWYDKHG